MYRAIVLAHIACGVIALVTYWMAGLSKKGSPLHKGAGRVYLLAMIGIALSSIVLAAGAFAAGKPVIGTFLAYLVVITSTAMWLGWTSIRRKRDQTRFRDRGYVALALGNVILWRAWRPLDEAKWWLREHIGAMLGCGIATHVAFLSIGVNRVVDLMGIEADLGLLPWFGPIVVAQLAGIWLRRKYLAKRATPASATPIAAS